MREASTSSESISTLAAGAELERVGADVVVGERAEDVAGPRAPQPDRGERRGQVDDLGRAVGRQVVAEPLAVEVAVRAAGDDPEAVLGQPHDRQVGAEAAALVDDRRVDDLARARRSSAPTAMRCTASNAPRPDDVEDHERRQVDVAGALAHRQVLGVDDRRPPARVPLGRAGHDARRRTRRAAPRSRRTSAGAPSRRSRRRTRRARPGWRASGRGARCGCCPTARPGGRCRRSC